MAAWLASLEAVGTPLIDALGAVVAKLEQAPEEMVASFKQKVPWVPCVNFQSVPRSSKKGSLHISMLSYSPCSYAANGMFVTDAKMLLQAQGVAGLEHHTLRVKPRAGASMTCFGWEPDGSVVNSTFAFALSSIVVFCL